MKGDIGVCDVAVLANFSCGISVILILNCGIAVFSKPAGGVLVNNTFFRPFLAISGCFRSNLKQPYFVTYFNNIF